VCILLAARRAGPTPELWVAANRDEHVDRPWAPPALLATHPPVFGGRDLLAGGSWLAVNLAAGFVVAVTNARLGAPRGERSRGELVVDVASQRTVAEAAALVGELDLERWGPFNLFIADAWSFWVATNLPSPALECLPESCVTIGNDSLASPGERVLAARGRACSLLSAPGDPEAGLRQLLADHDGSDPLCRHAGKYGTVCATVLHVAGRVVSRYLFAPGPPCVTPFAQVAVPPRGSLVA